REHYRYSFERSRIPSWRDLSGPSSVNNTRQVRVLEKVKGGGTDNSGVDELARLQEQYFDTVQQRIRRFSKFNFYDPSTFRFTVYAACLILPALSSNAEITGALHCLATGKIDDGLV
ncbi:hypothetical protein NDU88_003180, partial [Pleurodeles waltl]